MMLLQVFYHVVGLVEGLHVVQDEGELDQVVLLRGVLEEEAGQDQSRGPR